MTCASSGYGYRSSLLHAFLKEESFLGLRIGVSAFIFVILGCTFVFVGFGCVGVAMSFVGLVAFFVGIAVTAA